jgi:curved DNA-binding protein CbpA
MTVASAYKELGLSTDASIEDVKAAYRRLALKWCVESTSLNN